MPHLNLQFGIQFQDLYTVQGLKQLDAAFQAYEQTKGISAESLLERAACLQAFLADLFQIQAEVQALQAAYEDYQAINQCKKQFIQKIVRYDEGQDTITVQEMEILLGGPFSEARFARKVLEWLQDPTQYQQHYKAAKDFARLALQDPALQNLPLFQLPQPKDYHNLVPELTQSKAAAHQAYAARDGFALTDLGLSSQQAYLEAEYCLKCHTRNKDSCRTGLHDKANPAAILSNPLGRTLAGCPLEQKVSEMMILQGQGLTLAALAIIMIDNPMAVITGHRICNDCAAACIFQKQEPVDIPGVESHIVKAVLNLPWGVEIYGLLLRWHPLRSQLPRLKESQGGRALVVGAGPAGFTLAYYLLMQGHTVVNVDGLKIEPLAEEFLPLYSYQALQEDLDQRVIAGFGGVAEYGITSRWDKNALKVVRLLLERFDTYHLWGGVRFGSTLTPQQALEAYQFDHVALCTGAGQPKLLPLSQSLSKGIRMASDFLMNLQLLGAYKQDSITNLEIELPAVVIGGGLTAMDTATEILAYYPRQVERFYQRYQALLSQGADLLQRVQGDDRRKAETFIAHGEKIAAERNKAQKESRTPQFLSLLKAWGGVTVLYRQVLQNAPAYRLNHQEIRHALREGIEILAEATPQEFLLDEHQQVRAVRVGIAEDAKGTVIEIPAKTVMIAAGTLPNHTLFKEYDLSPYLEQISVLGDANPQYAGSVVKAIASAKHHYQRISQAITSRAQQKVTPEDNDQFITQLRQDLQTTVERVQVHSADVVEVVIKAPLMARNYQPGQFYRLQNFATRAPMVKGTRLMMEGLALSGSWVDKQQGLLGFLVAERGASSKLCRYLTPGEPVVLMGPTGTPTAIPTNETVCLIGDNWGNAPLTAVAQAIKAAGNQVIYLAGFSSQAAVMQQEQIEHAADQVIWVSQAEPLKSRRHQDQSFQGSLVQALHAWHQCQLVKSTPLNTIDRFLMMGSAGCLYALQATLGTELKSALKPSVKLIAAINAPMQCMMKEICAQCLQRHYDPATGKETYVYSCVAQEQPAHTVDFSFLQSRLQQNKVSEHLTDLWVEKCLQALEKQAH
jgi:NADPH-dependent glutamate synthase beta chain and related oxidoreductases